MLASTLRSFAPALRVALVAIATVAAVPLAVAADDEDAHTPHYPLESPSLERWTFSGPFGRFDEGQLQRGYQVYREVCAQCHSMDLVAFRHLGMPGGPHFSEDEVKALAAEFTIEDGPDDAGEMFERPGQQFDYFPAPYPNDQFAASVNNGAVPPDLSVIAKARAAPRHIGWMLPDFLTGYQEAGPNYIHALLTGYEDPPADFEVSAGTYYNPYFLAGASLAMAPPLTAGQVTYADGSPETVDQYARDVSAFLMWAAEPHLVQRKRMGFQVFVFLCVFAGLLYLTKQKVWAGTAH